MLVVLLHLCGLGALGAPSAKQPDPAEFAARSIARLALLDLRSRSHPSPEDYAVAAALLDSARVFAPDDLDLLHGRMRAAWASGDHAGLEALSRDLVRLDPADTVAQLRLASARIGDIQTVEGRLRAYDRLLGPGGASIDASVRSRLALDAALLEREHGSLDAFADRLTQALQLDSTNKEAAQLAWQAFAPLLDDPAERFELLLALLMADPTDPNVHRLIAGALTEVGAFEQANRFHALAVNLFLTADSAISDELRVESIAMQWQLFGPEAVVQALNLELLGMRQAAAEQILEFQEARMPTDSLTPPEDIMLAPQYNQIRLVASIMAGDQNSLGACLNDMQRSFQRSIALHQQRSALATEEEILVWEQRLWTDLARQLYAICWADVQDESVTEWVDRATRAMGADAPLVRSLDAWVELRFGDPATAIELFEPFLDLKLCRVGYGLAMEDAGKSDEATSWFADMARDAPLSLSGVWARSRVTQLTGEDPLATTQRDDLTRLAEGVPSWVDRMVFNPYEFMHLSAELDALSLGPVDRPVVRITLTNIAPVPLGVGGDRPINSRFMLAPRLQVGLHDEFERASAEVFELDRRLRLMPAESFTVEVWPDPGMVGWLSEVSALDTIRQRWRVLQGYRLTGSGVPQPGVLCLETQTGHLMRNSFALADAGPLELAEALETASVDSLPNVAGAIRARLLAPDSTLGADDVDRIAVVAASRYENLPLVGRAVLLSVLPSESVVPGMAPFDRSALAEQDPALIPVALASRVPNADHPAIAPLTEHQDDAIAEFARSFLAKLQSAEPTFSRLSATDLGATLRAPGE